MPTTQYVLSRINDKKTEISPFERVDTASYAALLLGKAYNLYGLSRISLASRPSQLVKYSD
jgi:hypothetical protein